MSKSAGNVVDPLDWIDAYGADAVRWTVARGGNLGVDLPVSEEWVLGSRNFVNKLWNATRFALLNGATVPDGDLPDGLAVHDRWILSRLTEVRSEVDRLYDEFEFAKVCDSLFHFAWDDLFDWYVELAKIPLREEGPAAVRTRAVLGRCFDTLLRLVHPVIPFVTDVLWRALTGGTTVVTADWPTVADARDRDAEEDVRRFQDLVVEVRRFRAQQGLRPGRRVAATIVGELAPWAPYLGALTDLTVVAADELPGGLAVLSTSGTRIGLDLSGAVDREAEVARLGRQLAAAERERDQTGRRLADDGFLGKAPDQVVATMRRRAAVAEEAIARLRQQLHDLTAS
jgi:valyl-tRNA synthetase